MLDKFNKGLDNAKRFENHPMIYGISHFGLNTFSDKEWGFGDDSPEIFNPEKFDADQIVSNCKKGGFDGLIIVCKHHDGFCLWPSKTTDYTIAKSPWRNGKGDLVQEFVDSCKKFDIKIGFYISPWDRNSEFYGEERYIEIFLEQIREVLSNYGEGFEVWFDGANGGDGYYGGENGARKVDTATYYPWEKIWDLVRELQPNAKIFSDIGPDLRWVGNEKGFANSGCSAFYTPIIAEGSTALSPGNAQYKLAPDGTPNGKYYIPAECDVPFRKGWFYHESEDDISYTVDELFEMYLKSIGNGAYLNLGIAPTKDGLLAECDIANLLAFKERIDTLYANKNDKEFNVIKLWEDFGETETPFEVEADGVVVAKGERIGITRLIKLDSIVKAENVILKTEAKTAYFETYLAPEEIFEKKARKADYRNLKNYNRPAILKNEGLTITYDLYIGTKLKGFVIFPIENAEGTPTHYKLEVSPDMREWSEIKSGEFSNIVNNPVPTAVDFPEVETRYIRLTATKLTGNCENINIKEFGVFVS